MSSKSIRCEAHPLHLYDMWSLIWSQCLPTSICYSCHELGDTYFGGGPYNIRICYNCIIRADKEHEYCIECTKLNGQAVYIKEYIEIPEYIQYKTKNTKKRM